VSVRIYFFIKKIIKRTISKTEIEFCRVINWCGEFHSWKNVDQNRFSEKKIEQIMETPRIIKMNVPINCMKKSERRIRPVKFSPILPNSAQFHSIHPDFCPIPPNSAQFSPFSQIHPNSAQFRQLLPKILEIL